MNTSPASQTLIVRNIIIVTTIDMTTVDIARIKTWLRKQWEI